MDTGLAALALAQRVSRFSNQIKATRLRGHKLEENRIEGRQEVVTRVK